MQIVAVGNNMIDLSVFSAATGLRNSYFNQEIVRLKLDIIFRAFSCFSLIFAQGVGCWSV